MNWRKEHFGWRKGVQQLRQRIGCSSPPRQPTGERAAGITWAAMSHGFWRELAETCWLGRIANSRWKVLKLNNHRGCNRQRCGGAIYHNCMLIWASILYNLCQKCNEVNMISFLFSNNNKFESLKQKCTQTDIMHTTHTSSHSN